MPSLKYVTGDMFNYWRHVKLLETCLTTGECLTEQNTKG